MDQVRAALVDAATLLLGRAQADVKRDAGQPDVPGSVVNPRESMTEDQLIDAIADASASGRRDEVARLGGLLSEKRRKR
jgi:tRNA U34 5-methylaminomethyl-2-thiouridine-forming methyltransferase MnmC